MQINFKINLLSNLPPFIHSEWGGHVQKSEKLFDCWRILKSYQTVCGRFLLRGKVRVDICRLGMDNPFNIK